MKDGDHFLLYTKPHMEKTAHDFLKAEGLKPYLPRFLAERSHAGRRDKVPVPLFPRYMFVLIEAHVPVRLLRTARGVSDIMKNNGGPSIVRRDVIMKLRSREDDEGFIRLEPSMAKFESYVPGEQLRIVGLDVMDNIIVSFTMMTTQARAKVAFQLFGSVREAEIDLINLERVARHVC